MGGASWLQNYIRDAIHIVSDLRQSLTTGAESVFTSSTTLPSPAADSSTTAVSFLTGGGLAVSFLLSPKRVSMYWPIRAEIRLCILGVEGEDLICFRRQAHVGEEMDSISTIETIWRWKPNPAYLGPLGVGGVGGGLFWQSCGGLGGLGSNDGSFDAVEGRSCQSRCSDR